MITEAEAQWQADLLRHHLDLQVENAALKRALKAFMTQLGNAESDLATAQESEGALQDRVSFLEEIDRD